MEECNKPLLIIINRCYPPYAGITGASAFELASFLQSRESIEIKAICIADNYGNLQSNGHPAHVVVGLKPFYSGKKKLPRLLSSVLESINMIRATKKMIRGRKNARVLVMTDPPLLNFFAALLFRNKINWGLWSMDLYPEGFYSSGMVSQGHFLIKIIRKVLRKYPPYFLITLGKAQYQFLRKTYQWDAQVFTIPCGIRTLPTENIVKPDWANTEKTIFGYCGNVGEAHNDDFILDSILSLNPDEHLFVASLYGSKGKKLAKKIMDFPHVIVRNNVIPEELSFIDVHLVSLRDRWVHVCVPSKVVSGVCMGASFLYNGTSDGDNWKYLGNAGWRINENYPIQELKHLIASLDKESVNNKRKAAKEISIILNDEKISEFNRFLNYLRMSGLLSKED